MQACCTGKSAASLWVSFQKDVCFLLQVIRVEQPGWNFQRPSFFFNQPVAFVFDIGGLGIHIAGNWALPQFFFKALMVSARSSVSLGPP